MKNCSKHAIHQFLAAMLLALLFAAGGCNSQQPGKVSAASPGSRDSQTASQAARVPEQSIEGCIVRRATAFYIEKQVRMNRRVHHEYRCLTC